MIALPSAVWRLYVQYVRRSRLLLKAVSIVSRVFVSKDPTILAPGLHAIIFQIFWCAGGLDRLDDRCSIMRRFYHFFRASTNTVSLNVLTVFFFESMMSGSAATAEFIVQTFVDERLARLVCGSRANSIDGCSIVLASTLEMRCCQSYAIR